MARPAIVDRLIAELLGPPRPASKSRRVNRRLSFEPLETRSMLAALTLVVNVTNDAVVATESADGQVDTDVITLGNQISLRAAIQRANEWNDDVVITFADGLGAINLSRTVIQDDDDGVGDLDISKPIGSLTIQGNVTSPTVINANQNDRVLEIHPGSTARLYGLQLSGGLKPFLDGIATDEFFGGGIYNRGVLLLEFCIVSGNSATSGGGIANINGHLTILESTIRTNIGSVGGGIMLAAPLSTPAGQVIIQNSTISGNSAEQGGGIGDYSFGDVDIYILNSTIANNRASDDSSGGIFATRDNNQPSNGFLLTLINTLVADNIGANNAPRDVDGPISVQSRNNLIEIYGNFRDQTASEISTLLAQNQIGVPGSPLNALLGPLADNGGPTPTHALLAGSPAIDAADDAAAGDLFTDQRGSARSLAGEGNEAHVDIGSFEYDPTPIAQAIVRTEPSGSTTNATGVKYTVTFNKPVTGVGDDDFLVTPLGDVTANPVVTVQGSGTVYTVTIDQISGNGQLGLKLVPNGSIVDATLKPLVSEAIAELYTIDQTAPVVQNITRLSPLTATTSASNVTFRVTFSEPVTGVTAEDFAILPLGVTTAPQVSLTGSGAVYDVTVSNINGSGTVRLDLIADGTIIDAASNPLAADFIQGEVYTIEPPPFVESITRAAGASPLTNAPTVAFTVTFDKAVTGVDLADFALVHPDTLGAALSQVTPISATVYTVTVTGITGDGSLSLRLIDNDTILDLFDTPLGRVGLANGNFQGEAYTIDRTPPVVQSISRLTPVEPTTSDTTVTYAVKFSEPVAGVDTDDFTVVIDPTLSVGLVDVVPQLNGTDYIVTIYDIFGNGDLGLNLVDKDTVLDLAGNPLGGVGVGSSSPGEPFPGSGDYVGETYSVVQPPLVKSIARTTPVGPLTNASSVTYTVTFSMPVTGVDETDFVLFTTGSVATTGVAPLKVVHDPLDPGVAATRYSPSAGNFTITEYTTYLVTVTGIVGDGDLRLDLQDDNSIYSIKDSYNVILLGGQVVGDGNKMGETYNFDHTPPFVSSINRTTPPGRITNAEEVTYTVTFSEAVEGVDSSDFAVVRTPLSPATLTANTQVQVVGAGNVYQVTITGIDGAGTLGLNLVDDNSITDKAVNPLGSKIGPIGTFVGEEYQIDRVAPQLSHIVRATDTTPGMVAGQVRYYTGKGSVAFTFTFSEPVQGIDASHFSLVKSGGLAADPLLQVTSSGAKYTVTVNGLKGDGELHVDLIAPATVTDGATNPLAGSEGKRVFSSPEYSIRQSSPTIDVKSTVSVTSAPVISVSSVSVSAVQVDNGVTITVTVINTALLPLSIDGVTITNDATKQQYVLRREGGASAAQTVVLEPGQKAVFTDNIPSVLGPQLFNAKVSATDLLSRSISNEATSEYVGKAIVDPPVPPETPMDPPFPKPAIDQITFSFPQGGVVAADGGPSKAQLVLAVARSGGGGMGVATDARPFELPEVNAVAVEEETTLLDDGAKEVLQTLAKGDTSGVDYSELADETPNVKRAVIADAEHMPFNFNVDEPSQAVVDWQWYAKRVAGLLLGTSLLVLLISWLRKRKSQGDEASDGSDDAQLGDAQPDDATLDDALPVEKFSIRFELPVKGRMPAEDEIHINQQL